MRSPLVGSLVVGSLVEGSLVAEGSLVGMPGGGKSAGRKVK